MINVSEFTRTVKEIASAVSGGWEAKFDAKCRYVLAGHVAFCQCVGQASAYSFPFEAMGWYKVGSTDEHGFSLYITLVR